MADGPSLLQVQEDVRRLESKLDRVIELLSGRVECRSQPTGPARPNITLDEWIAALECSAEQLCVVFGKGHAAGVKKCIEDHCNQHPFRIEKRMLMGWDGEAWLGIDETLLGSVSERLNKVILGALMKWQSNNASAVKGGKFADVFGQNVKRALGGGRSQQDVLDGIRKSLRALGRG